MSTLSGGPNMVTDGLVLYLDSRNTRSYSGTGNVVNDLSKNINVGVLTNGVTLSSENSFLFDGVDDYINISNVSSLDILNFTVCVWAKSSTFTNFQNVIFKGDNSAGQYGIAFNSAGQWCVQPNNTFINDVISLNTWNFFVGKYDGSSITAYRNGVERTNYVISQSSRGIIVSIGADIPNSRYFNGSIGLVQIYNRPLSLFEIQQNYNATRSRFGL